MDASQLGPAEGFGVTDGQLRWLDDRPIAHLVFPEVISNISGTPGIVDLDAFRWWIGR